MLNNTMIFLLSLYSFNSFGASLSCPGVTNEVGYYNTSQLFNVYYKDKFWVQLPQGLMAASDKWGLRQGSCVTVAEDRLACVQPASSTSIQFYFTLIQPYPLYGNGLDLYSNESFSWKVDRLGILAPNLTPTWTLNLPDNISFGDMRVGERKEITIITSTTGQSDNPAYMNPQWTEKDGVRFEPSGDLVSNSDGSQWILKDNGENKLKIIIEDHAIPGDINLPVNIVHTCN